MAPPAETNRGIPVRGTFAPRLRVSLLGGLLAATPGCGLGDRQHRADVIVESVDRVFASDSASGTLTAQVRVLKTPDVGRRAPEEADAPALPEQAFPPLPAVTFDVGLDFAQRRAVLGREGKPTEIFDGLDLYGVRLAATERDARPWLRVSLEDLVEGTGELNVPQDSPSAVMNAISPIVLVDLAAGALAGSIDSGVPETVDGVELTRYDANFDIEKSLEKTRDDAYPEDILEPLETSFDLLTLHGTVHEGSVWLDAEGRLRRFRLELEVSKQRDFVFGVELDLVMGAYGEPVKVPVPEEASILEADSLVSFLRLVVPEISMEAGL